MPKNKRPVPRKKAHKPAKEDDDVQAQAIVDLALEVVELGFGLGLSDEDEDEAMLDAGDALVDDLLVDDPELEEALAVKDEELTHLIRNALRKNKDTVLYGAINSCQYIDDLTYQMLRQRIEEAASSVTLHREGEADVEVNAFALPLFVHSSGALKANEDFTDGDAFERLVASLQEAGLESPDAKVVMLSHAYDLQEIKRISYCDLQAMVRDAAGSMTEKKLVARPALEHSMSGWAETTFAPADKAVELRFLIGFALKRVDDPFYAVPDEEAEADAYFEARMGRYREWTEVVKPLVKRCLAADPDSIELFFLYQDDFFAARQQGIDELETLEMMSELGAALAEENLQPADVRAMIVPVSDDDGLILRVKLFNSADAAIASAVKEIDPAALPDAAIEDLYDALTTMGIPKVEVAEGIGIDGKPINPVEYE